MTATSVLAAYLAVSAIPASIAFGSGRAPAVLLILHLAALATAGTLIYRGTDGWFADWLPLIAVPLLYAELPSLMLSSQTHDGVVQSWEAAWFGASPAHAAAGRWPIPMLSELLHAAYLSYYAIIVVPPLVLYLRGDRLEFQRTMTVLLTVFALCFTIFIAFPVAGPRYFWAPPPGVYDGPIRRVVLQLLEAGSSRGTAFPSSHVAVAAAQSVMVLTWNRKAGIGLSVLTLLLALGAVYGGFHYGVDAIAGGFVGCAIAMLFSLLNHDDVVATVVALPFPRVDA